VPDCLFNTGTLQRKYILTAVVTCLQVLTAVVDQMMTVFQVSAYLSNHYVVQKHKTRRVADQQPW
jgi:hypothetical protein